MSEKLNFNQSPTSMSSSEAPEKKKYAKLIPEVKEAFLRKIIFDNLSIKDASESLNINYSSAKAILSAHKKSILSKPKKSWHRKNKKVCSYQEITYNNLPKGTLTIATSLGGLSVSQHQISRTKIIHKLKPVQIIESSEM